MSTWIDVMAYGVETAVIIAAVERIRQLEQMWSRFIRTSDITRLNNAAGRAVVVDSSTISLVKQMCRAHLQTGGRFDPTTLPALVDAGYYASTTNAGIITVLPADATTSGWQLSAIQVDEAHQTIQLPAGLALDPGGIGKGLAADLVVDELIQQGATSALVSLGGDLAVKGTTPDQRGWPVQILDPFRPAETLVELWLTTGGLATSSTIKRTWVGATGEQHHTIDPATNRPAQTDIAAVTVMADSATAAEAHATAAVILGSLGAIDYLEAAGLHGCVITRDNTVRLTHWLEQAWEAPIKGRPQ